MSLCRLDQWPPELLCALAPLCRLLDDDAVTEIEANAHDQVYAKGPAWPGHRPMPGLGWQDAEDFRVACVRISEVIRRRISESRPLLNGRLPGGERVNIVIPPACERIALTIRKFPRETMTLERLVELSTLSPDLATMARSLVLARKSLIISGGTGSGKTSTLNALSRLIPPTERVVTIEDARELQIQQPNWVALETVEPYSDKQLPVTIGDLVRNALRQTPDRIIVGEVRGEEALYLLRAFSSGHGGGFGTVHCNDAEDALHMLQFLAQMAPLGMNPAALGLLVGRAVDIVLHQEILESEGGTRRVKELIEVDHPGGAWIHPSGHVEFRYRRLATWNPLAEAWDFPQAPSPALQRTLLLQKLPWPASSLQAPPRGN